MLGVCRSLERERVPAVQGESGLPHQPRLPDERHPPGEQTTQIDWVEATGPAGSGWGGVEALDGEVGPVKQRARGLSGGELLVGLASAQVAGQATLSGLDRLRCDEAGGLLVVVPFAPSRTAPGWRAGSTRVRWAGSRRRSGCWRRAGWPGCRPSAVPSWSPGGRRLTWTPRTWRSSAGSSVVWPIPTRGRK